MPFLGKDWRSSGDQWIRTDLGWERTKVLECILDNLNSGLKKEKKQKAASSSSPSTSLSSSSSSSSNDNKRMNSECDDDDDEDEDEMALEQMQEDKEAFFFGQLILTDEVDEAAPAKAEAADSTTLKAKKQRQRQPHIIYFCNEMLSGSSNRVENNAPKASVSEVLNALDMPGAVRDMKRFNYVCKLVQLIINEKLNQLSGNAQRTLFTIVKEMLIQVIRTQENVNVMRKLLHDFKKKIQDSYFYYFYYIGSQKLCERHLATISKWQEMLENPNNHKRVKRLMMNNNNNDKENNNSLTTTTTTTTTNFETIPFDCKLEIIRRLNTGLDLVNLAKCNRSLNDIVSRELTIWKNLCQFHFQQTNINSLLVNRNTKNASSSSSLSSASAAVSAAKTADDELDWKSIYFKLKRRYGHREVYVDMIHRCFYCKSLFWKEIGHPCVIALSLTNASSNNNNNNFDSTNLIDIRTEPITPKKLIDLLLK